MSTIPRKTTTHYAAVGYVASSWAAFEQTLQRELWELCGIEGVIGAILTANIGISARFLDALQALCLLRGANKSSLKALDKLAGKSLGLAKQRNRAVHDPWGFDVESGQPYRLEVSAAKELKFGPVIVTTAELNDLAKEIISHTEKFEECMRNIKAQLVSLPDTPP